MAPTVNEWPCDSWLLLRGAIKKESRYTPLNLHAVREMQLSSSAVSPHYLPLWTERRTNPLTLWTRSQRSTNIATLIQQSRLQLLPPTTVGTTGDWTSTCSVRVQVKRCDTDSAAGACWENRVVIWLLHLSQKWGVNSPSASAWNESGVWRDWVGCEGNQKEMLQEFCAPVWKRKEADPHGFIMWGWNKTFPL